MFDVMDLSWFILRRCADNGTPISNLQLQKILYFLQRLNLIQTGHVLFNADIRAWQFGPVVREVYYNFSIYSSLRIVPTDFSPSPDLELEIFLLDEIDKRATQRPWDMVDETHQAGRAWDQIFQNGRGNDRIIPVELITNNG